MPTGPIGGPARPPQQPPQVINPVSSSFPDLASTSFGAGSSSRPQSGIKFGTEVGDIVAGEPVFPAHLLSLYAVLTGGVNAADVGVDGRISAQEAVVNRGLLTAGLAVREDASIFGDADVRGGVSVGGLLEASGGLDLTGELDGDMTLGAGFVSAFNAEATSRTGTISLESAQSRDLEFNVEADSITNTYLSIDETQEGFVVNVPARLGLGGIGGSGTPQLRVAGVVSAAELEGGGFQGDPLGVAERAIGYDKLADGAPRSVRITNDTGRQAELEMQPNSFPARGDTGFYDARVREDRIVGRLSGGIIGGLTLDEVRDAMTIRPVDITIRGADAFAERTFTADPISSNIGFLARTLIHTESDPTLRVQTTRDIDSDDADSNATIELRSSSSVAQGESGRLIQRFSTDDDGNLELSQTEIIATGSLFMEARGSGSVNGNVTLKSESNDVRLNAGSDLLLDGGLLTLLRAGADIRLEAGRNSSLPRAISLDPAPNGIVFFGGSDFGDSFFAVDVKNKCLHLRSRQGVVPDSEVRPNWAVMWARRFNDGNINLAWKEKRSDGSIATDDIF